MRARASASSPNAEAKALKILQDLLDDKQRLREADGGETSLVVRDIILRQLLKSASGQGKGRAAAFKFMATYSGDHTEALARWRRACKASKLPTGWASFARGNVVRLPFPCEIQKVSAHAATLDDDAKVDFISELWRNWGEGPLEFLSEAWLLRDKAQIEKHKAEARND